MSSMIQEETERLESSSNGLNWKERSDRQQYEVGIEEIVSLKASLGSEVKKQQSELYAEGEGVSETKTKLLAEWELENDGAIEGIGREVTEFSKIESSVELW